MCPICDFEWARQNVSVRHSRLSIVRWKTFSDIVFFDFHVHEIPKLQTLKPLGLIIQSLWASSYLSLVGTLGVWNFKMSPNSVGSLGFSHAMLSLRVCEFGVVFAMLCLRV